MRKRGGPVPHGPAGAGESRAEAQRLLAADAWSAARGASWSRVRDPRDTAFQGAKPRGYVERADAVQKSLPSGAHSMAVNVNRGCSAAQSPGNNCLRRPVTPATGRRQPPAPGASPHGQHVCFRCPLPVARCPLPESTMRAKAHQPTRGWRTWGPQLPSRAPVMPRTQTVDRSAAPSHQFTPPAYCRPFRALWREGSRSAHKNVSVLSITRRVVGVGRVSYVTCAAIANRLALTRDHGSRPGQGLRMLTLAGPLGATSCEQWERSESSLVAENEHANTMGPGRLRCFNARHAPPAK